MSGPRRIWTVAEANARVPGLTMLIGNQMARAAEIERRWKRFVTEVGPERADFSRLVGQSGAQLAASGDALPEELELRELLNAYESEWREIEESGVSVKDPRIGLCDFYGKVEGKPVWLCWRYGETAVDYYHGLEAGFAGRKPITTSAKPRLLN